MKIPVLLKTLMKIQMIQMMIIDMKKGKVQENPQVLAKMSNLEDLEGLYQD